MDKTKLGILAGSTNEDYQVDFLFYPKGASKTSTMEICERKDRKGFEVKACGEFTSPSLKAGVIKYLEPMIDQLDLRIKGVIYDGGMYSGKDGLTSWIEGGDYEEKTSDWPKTFPLVNQWSFS